MFLRIIAQRMQGAVLGAAAALAALLLCAVALVITLACAAPLKRLQA